MAKNRENKFPRNFLFCKNAWADGKVVQEWCKKTLEPITSEEDRFVLFLDNLTAQESDSFKKQIFEMGGLCWYRLPNATDLWQPVDAGFANLLKVIMFNESFDKKGLFYKFPKKCENLIFLYSRD